MLVLYNFGIRIYYVLIVVFQFFNKKAKLWILGRKEIYDKITANVDINYKTIWFHFASLGEFEQGRPVMEEMRKLYTDRKFLVTFFSPSGYELRKNYQGADYIFYLPIDTQKNASKFIDLVKPEMAIFTKYEFWYHYFDQLHQRGIPLYLISGIFRPDQPFFKWYGSLNRKILSFVEHFFVQDEGSRNLLATIGINNVTVSGDTRFDRVAENALAPKKFEIVEQFCNNANVFVAGSTWPDDEKLIAELAQEYPGWKFIIAPHEIKEEKINTLTELLPSGRTARYSELKLLSDKTENIDSFQSKATASQTLIIDNIGMLSSLYQYGKIAYIGGGFGVGIHNTLEAAAFGVPIIFGPNYQKFLEAKALIKNGGGFTINNLKELKEIVSRLQNTEIRKAAGNAAGKYVMESKGATYSVLNYIKNKKAV